MGLLPVLILIPMVILLMWSSRSQSKKQAAALASLQKGDRVLLQSGLIGKLVEMGERTAKVEIASGVKIEVLRTAISGKDGGDGTVAATK
ncbi:MAG: preprotein translocase subunit YajC [Polyangiaceae bacterium]|jgi:preprotein translocase subunit YajC